MPKLIFLKGDQPEAGRVFSEDCFLFIFTKAGVYHIDLSDGKMYLCSAQMNELSEAHRELVKRNLKTDKLVD